PGPLDANEVRYRTAPQALATSETLASPPGCSKIRCPRWPGWPRGRGGGLLVGGPAVLPVLVLIEERGASALAGAAGRGGTADVAARAGVLLLGGFGRLRHGGLGGRRLLRGDRAGAGRTPGVRCAQVHVAGGARGDRCRHIGRQRHRDGVPAVALPRAPLPLALLVDPLGVVGLLDQCAPVGGERGQAGVRGGAGGHAVLRFGGLGLLGRGAVVRPAPAVVQAPGGGLGLPA